MSQQQIDTQPAPQLYQPRSVPTARGVEWLADGLKIFQAQASNWLSVCFIGLGLLIAMIVVSGIPGGNVVIGLFNYVWIAGLAMGCRDIEQGKQLTVAHLFAAFKVNLLRLVLLGFIMLVFSTLLMALAFGDAYQQIVAQGFSGTDGEPDLSVFNDPELQLRVLLAFALYIPFTMMVWFAPLLIVLHDAPIGPALRLSFFACLRNVLPFLVYSVLLLIAFVVGAMPFMLGLLVVAPMYFGSVYASYKDIFLHQPNVLESAQNESQ